MLFWFIAVLLTLGASLAVLLPMTRRAKPDFPGGAHDLEVYRDQLAELDRDIARKIINPAEADQARAEIARRIIRAGSAQADAQPPRLARAGRFVGAASVLAIPLISWGLYTAVGSPELPSQPLTERLAQDPAKASVDELVARAEGHLAANPSDGRGWDVLAPIYFRIGRFADSVTAYRNAIRLDGDSADRQAGLGEAIAYVGGGLVSADAQAAFERALKLQDDHVKARFYLAVALAQEGKVAEAETAWRALLGALPAQSPWRAAVEQALAGTAARVAQNSGPDQQAIDEAAAMPEADRNAMIETMVAGLDAKLRQNPNDLEGWMRLVRSYKVLGRTGQARDAMSRGLDALGAASEDGKKFAEFAATLDLSATE